MRRVMALVLCAALLCVLPAAQAQENGLMESGGFQYEVQKDGTAVIVGYTEESTRDYNVRQSHEITFPSWLDGHIVTAIGDDIFGDYFWVESVLIPETIVFISSLALNLGRIENIFVLPGNPVYESVGGVLYDKTKRLLHSYPGSRWSDRYSVRQGTTAIGEYAFYGAYRLKTIELPETLLEIGKGAFMNCTGLSEAVLPKALLRIGEEAFYYCQSLKQAVIPANVIGIGAMAFSMCRGMDALSVDEGNSSYMSESGVLFSKNGKRLHAYPGNKKDAEYTVPETAEAILEEAFAGNIHLKKAVIHAGVKSMDDAVFAGCESLTEIEVAEGNGRYHDEDGVLFGTGSRRLKAYPAGREDTAYEIPAGTLAIEDAAFSYCMYLEDIVIPDSVLTLGEAAFYQCHGLREITLPARVTDIGRHSFSECSMLRSITIPAGVKAIGEGTFQACYNLTDIDLPVGLQSIGYTAFGGCMQLMGVYIPATVTMIDKDAFYGCEHLILEVNEESYGHTFAQENEMVFTLHPDWL